MNFIKTFGKNLLNMIRTRAAIATIIITLAAAGGLALAPETAEKLANVACDVIHCVDVPVEAPEAVTE